MKSAAGSATDATRMPCNNRIESRCAVSIINRPRSSRPADYMNRGRSLSDVKSGQSIGSREPRQHRGIQGRQRSPRGSEKMAEQQAGPSGPDLAQGVALNEFTGETLLGHVGDQDVLLVRADGEIFAI